MEHIIDCEVCDECYENGITSPIEYHALVSSPANKVIWYECGRVIVIHDHVVVIEHNFVE